MRCKTLTRAAATGLPALVLVLAMTPTAVAQGREPDGDAGQVTVTPGDSLGWNQPPRVRIDAEHRTWSDASGSSAGKATRASGNSSAGSGGADSGPTCRVERPSEGGFVDSSTSPKEMRRYFPDLYLGNRGGDESQVYIARCSDGSIGWVTGDGAGAAPGGRAVLPTPGELAERARQMLVLPLPTPGMSPKLRLDDGREATLVRENTWVWVDPGVWAERSERVEVGPVWAEVTARPRSMRFDSGMGQVVCDGPGTPYDRSYGMHAASPDCGVVFHRSTYGMPGEQTTAEYAITWSVSWRGSTGTTDEGGELPDMISRTTESFAVAEAHSLRAN